MYKTIRHGENSLQYTILPQNDDFRLDGKIQSSNSNNNVSSSSSKLKRHGRKRSFFAYLGLIFVCTVIIGAILIPFLVSTECLPNPSDWFLKAKVAFSTSTTTNATTTINTNTTTITNTTNTNTITTTTKHGLINDDKNSNNINTKKNNKTESTINAYLDSNNYQKNRQQLKQNVIQTTNIPTTVITVNNNEHNNIVTTLFPSSSLMSLSLSDNLYTIPRKSNNIRKKVLDSQYYNTILSTEKGIAAVIDDEINFNTIQNKVTKSTTMVILPKTTLKKTTKTTTVTSVSTTTTSQPITATSSSVLLEESSSKDSTEDELIKKGRLMVNNHESASSLSSPPPEILRKLSSTNKPIILPVLAKTNSVIKENGKYVDRHVENKNWIHSHWPFVDPSTYFQWVGVKSEDSVLLPAILGLALVGLILIIALCLVVRHKNKIVSSVRNRNRNSIQEETGEDNTTLLTTGNTSDDD